MSNRRILIVDDSPTDLRVISDALSGQGYHVLTATTGEEALETIEREQPDVVVLDIVLPEMNGYEVCRHIKATDTTRDVKVLMLTAKRTRIDRYWGQRQGADGYMTKPFAGEDLRSNVAALA